MLDFSNWQLSKDDALMIFRRSQFQKPKFPVVAHFGFVSSTLPFHVSISLPHIPLSTAA